MEITIPIGQILSFDWLNLRNVLVANVLYGMMAHYRGLYHVRKWNNNPELRSKIREQYARRRHEAASQDEVSLPSMMEFREINKIDMLKAFGIYMVAGLPLRLIYAAARTLWNVALRPLSYIVCGLVCLSCPKLPACPSWRKTLISDCWLRADDQNLLYLPCLYQFLLERNRLA